MKKLAVIFAAALLSVIVCDLAVSKTSGTAERDRDGAGISGRACVRGG